MYMSVFLVIVHIEESVPCLSRDVLPRVKQILLIYRATFASTSRALGGRLDKGGKALAAQEFCHTVQRSSAVVSDFIL